MPNSVRLIVLIGLTIAAGAAVHFGMTIADGLGFLSRLLS